MIMNIQDCFIGAFIITGQLPKVLIKKNIEATYAFLKVAKLENKRTFER